MWRASQTVSKGFNSLGPRLTSTPQNSVRTCTSKAPGPGSPKAASEPVKPAEPEPIPPPPPKKGGFFWKLIGLSLVGSSGVVAYAWYDNKFKEQVEQTVPFSKPALNYVFQYLPQREAKKEVAPKKSLQESLAVDVEEAKRLSLQKKTPAIEIPKEQTVATTKPKVEEIKPTKAEIEAKRKEEEKKQKEEKKKREKEEAERRIKEKEMEDAADNAALENILQTSLAEAQFMAETAIELQVSSAEATREHTKQLRQAMDVKGQDTESQWEAATTAFSAKSDGLAKAESMTDEARVCLEKVRAAISEGKANKVTKQNKSISSTEQTLNSLNYDLKTAIAQNAKAQSEAKVMAEYRDLVKKGKEQFRKEIESITPDVSTAKKGGKLTEEELNSLIAHAHRRIEQIQQQLAEQQALEQLRIETALERQREEDEKLGDSRVEQEKERTKADLVVQRDRWDAESRISFELELRKQLARQAAAHSDHLAEVLKVQEHELKAKFDILLNESLIDERDQFEKEVAGWIARLKGIESAVEGRAEMEQQGRKAQELWLACQMLQNVIENGNKDPEAESITSDDFDEIPYEKTMKPLLEEYVAVLEASNNHPFVNSILETIPDESVKNGVWTEKALLDRFVTVRRICRRTAMIDESGGSLFRYILSHLQSFFVFNTSKPLTESDKADPNQLSTFVLLDNAHFYVEHGDLEQALRFMSQLRGEPQRVAADWIKQARLLLETRQSASALVAHASANGLGALF